MNRLKPFLTRNHIAALILGMLVTMVAFQLYFRLVPPIKKEYVVAAKNTGVEPRVYNDMMSMMDKLQEKHDLNSEEWNRLKRYLRDEVTQRTAISTLMLLRRSTYREEAIQLSREFLQSKNVSMENAALTSLHHLNAPEWREEAQRRTNRPEELIRQGATKLLDMEKNKQ